MQSNVIRLGNREVLIAIQSVFEICGFISYKYIDLKMPEIVKCTAEKS